MDGIQGAILGVKLRHLDGWIEARRRHAKLYDAQLADAGVEVPVERQHARHVFHLYVVGLDDRDRWRARLTEAGVQTGIHYPIPVHLQPAYRDLGYLRGDFPVAEHAAGQVLSLPIYPELTADQIATVTGVLRASVTPA
jgi:dTDP-4-amino-4,6-dideoxygalactose transaminase